jgi:hypothetical protein
MDRKTAYVAMDKQQHEFSIEGNNSDSKTHVTGASEKE